MRMVVVVSLQECSFQFLLVLKIKLRVIKTNHSLCPIQKRFLQTLFCLTLAETYSELSYLCHLNPNLKPRLNYLNFSFVLLKDQSEDSKFCIELVHFSVPRFISFINQAHSTVLKVVS